jgi:virulence-associated protein VagC
MPSRMIRIEEGEQDKSLYINKIDGILMVVPETALWKIFEASLDKFSEDFMNDRGFDIKDSRDQL